MCFKVDKDKYLAAASQFVVKSNDFVQHKRFKLTLAQQKMILYIVSKIKPSDSDFHTYTFNIADFCKLCQLDNIGGKQYDTLKDSLKELHDKSSYVQIDDNTETLVCWIEKPTFHKNIGTVDIRLDKDLKPYFLDLKSSYTKYELINVLRMKYRYSPRLYELLKSYHYDKTETREEEFTVKEIVKLLFLDENTRDSKNKSKEDKNSTYTEYKYLNRDILKPCISEINEQTDIHVDYKPIRFGHKVTGVTFFISSRNPLEYIAACKETDDLFIDDSPEEQQQPEPERASEQPDSSQTVTAAASVQQPKKPKPAEPVPKEQPQQPKPKRESKGKRYQVRIFARGTKNLLKTFSKYSVEEVVSAANEWLYNNGFPQIETFTGSSLRWEV